MEQRRDLCEVVSQSIVTIWLLCEKQNNQLDKRMNARYYHGMTKRDAHNQAKRVLMRLRTFFQDRRTFQKTAHECVQNVRETTKHFMSEEARALPSRLSERVKCARRFVVQNPVLLGGAVVCAVVAGGLSGAVLVDIDRSSIGQVEAMSARGQTDVGERVTTLGWSQTDEREEANSNQGDAGFAHDETDSDRGETVSFDDIRAMDVIASRLGAGAANALVVQCVSVAQDKVQAAHDEVLQSAIASALDADAVRSIDAASDTPQVFSLLEQGASTERDLSALSSAIAAIETQGYTVGCFMIDVDTGNGVAYSLDSRVYGASSFKGPYAAFLCERLADGGQGLSASSMSLIESMVTYSDNDAFRILRNTYDSAGFTDWVASCGVATDIVHDTHFPRYSARESALLWLHMYDYLESGADHASYLAELYQQTNTSFIRDGVSAVQDGAQDGEGGDGETQDDSQSSESSGAEGGAQDNGGSGAENDATHEGENLDSETQNAETPVVMNKAGWNASGTRFSGLCDAGIIEYQGKTYIMSVMCSAPDSESHRAQVSAVVRALFDLR